MRVTDRRGARQTGEGQRPASGVGGHLEVQFELPGGGVDGGAHAGHVRGAAFGTDQAVHLVVHLVVVGVGAGADRMKNCQEGQGRKNKARHGTAP